MKQYKAQLTLLSPLGTPLAADTLFGHICWSMAYGEGDEKLGEFLSRMDSDKPPLLLSDPFPAGRLPVPILPTYRDPQQTANFSIDEKDLRKIHYIDSDRLADCLQDLNGKSLMESLRCQHQQESDLSDDDTQKRVKKIAISPHNRVSRFGSGTVQGGVFFTEDTFTAQYGSFYDLYIASDEYDAGGLKGILEEALAWGYGRDKSIGRGAIKVERVEPVSLPDVKHPNAVMLLGPCAPAQSDPVKGFWSIKAKTGRLGGHWAISEFPFKKTIMMLQAGSVLLTDIPRPFYGRMIHDVHDTLKQVVHYGLSLALPIRLSRDSVEAA